MYEKAYKNRATATTTEATTEKKAKNKNHSFSTIKTNNIHANQLKVYKELYWLSSMYEDVCVCVCECV